MTWRDNAVCIDYDPEIFFPKRSSRHYVEDVAYAKSICAQCPVTQQCLQEGRNIGRSGYYGIRGGLTADERHRR